MKRRQVVKKIIISFLIVLALVFAIGCSSNKSEQPSADAEKIEDAEKTEDAEADAKEEETQDKEGDSKVASKEDMVEAEDVVEDWMVPMGTESLKEGTYPITVASSSSMFKIEKAELTVAHGEMSCVMTMGGKGYRYIFMGTGEEAVDSKEDTYIGYEEDGDGAHTFTVPVEALDKGIACSAFSNKKEKWYDRILVFRSDSLPLEAFDESLIVTPQSLGLADGEYSIDVTLGGGTGRSTVESPAQIKIAEGQCTATIVWSSPHYDYMIVDGEKYLPVNQDGNSTFEIPVKAFDRPLPVIGDTVAMNEPHEIDYVLSFDSKTIK